jgi:hypothetical protein
VDRYFACRHCHRLVYTSPYEQPWQRAFRRANKLKLHLGITDDAGIADAPTLPEKPPHMHVNTYERLLEEISHAEIKATEARTAWFSKYVSQVEDRARRRARRKVRFTL